jgi:excisionase family DNA binding protein
MIDKTPRLLRRKEACDLLGISLSRYKLLIASGRMREIRIGLRGKRLPASEIDRFVAEGMET